MTDILDITFPLTRELTVWPGDTQADISTLKEAGKNARSMVSRLTLSSHAGTHVDAPAHFIEGGDTVEALSPEVLMGACRVVEISDNEITAGVVDALNLPEGVERILFKTTNSSRFSGTEPFFKDYVGVTVCGAERLLDMGIKLIGLDYLSAAAYSDIEAVHRTLLGHRVVLLETLDLRKVSPGEYRLVCLPLRLPGVDGSPCRALLTRS